MLPAKNCNCRNKPACPLDGKCLTTGVIYQATITRQDTVKKETYIGLTEGPFKTRYNCHTSTFRNVKQRNATSLSHFIWTLKDKQIMYSIKWRIMARSRGYSTSSKRCNLCLSEKYFIIMKPLMASLNNRNELASGCRHRRKHLLCNFK